MESLAKLDSSFQGLLSLVDDLVDKAVGLCFFGGHEVVALGVDLDRLERLAGVGGKDLVQTLLDLQHALDLDLHVGRLPLRAAGGLVDHDLRVGKGKALALRAGGQQKCAHRRGHAHADGGHVALDELHGVIDRHAVGHAAAGGVDVELNVLIGVLCLKIEQLRNDQTGSGAVDLFGQDDDTVVEQAGENVLRPLAAACLLDNIRN